MTKSLLSLRLLLSGFLPFLLAPGRLHAEWVQTQGPESGHVNALAEVRRVLLAGMDGGGVYRSRDNGSTWIPANRGIECANIHALTIHGNLLFAGASGDRNDCSQGIGGVGGIFLSSDSGASWIRVDSGLVDPNITDLVVYGGGLFTRTRIFAATRSGGVIRSADNWKSWQGVNEGLPTVDVRRPYYATINELHLSGGALYAATSVGLYYSTDHGESWTPRQRGFPEFQGRYPKYLSVVRLAQSGSTLIAATDGHGLFRSNKRGASWAPVQNEEGDDSLLFVHTLAASGRHLYAGTSYGIYHSSDRGRFWAPLNSEHAKSAITCLAASGFRSRDQGGGWTPLVIEKQTAINFMPAANTPDVFALTALGLFRSADHGETWAHIESKTAQPIFTCLAAQGSILFAGTKAGLFHSSDSGSTWTEMDEQPERNPIDFLAVHGRYLFAGSQLGFRAYHSLDGSSWKLVEDEKTFPRFPPIHRPLDKAFWSAYFGMLTDKFGNAWMVSYNKSRGRWLGLG